MKPLEWSDKLSIDQSVIDDEHHVLIGIVNKFRAKAEHFETAEEMIKILDELVLYTTHHFRNEISLQRAASYPYWEAHENEHHHLFKLLEKLMDEARLARGSYVKTMAEKIGDFLRDWLIDHLVNSDMRMKPYVDKMRVHAKTLKPLKNLKPD